MSPIPQPRSAPRQGGADAARAPRSLYRLGVVRSLPFLIVMMPFGMLFGVVATKAGMDVGQILGFSVLVLAGASQFTAVQLLSENAPVLIVILSSLAVNLRMAMYSAALVPWLRGASPAQRAMVAYSLVDQSYALAVQEYEADPRLTLGQRLAFFAGVVTVVCLPWMIFSWIGATLGQAIPEGIALDFAMPITFLAMIAPMLRSAAHLAACFVAIVAALLLAGLPSGLGLLIAAPLGMAAGALVETRASRKARA